MRSLAALAIDWLVIAACIYADATTGGFWFYPMAVFIIGNRLFALSLLMHDAVHGTLFKNRSWNRGLTIFYGWPQFQTYDRYRRHHLLHHRFLGTPKDPTKGILRYYLSAQTPTPYRLIVRPFLGRQVRGLARDFWRGVRQDSDFRILAPLIFVSAMALALWTGYGFALIKYWIVPLFLVYPVFVFWGEFMDHWGTESLVRSTQIPLPLRWILGPHNSTAHCAHHRWPRTPWFNLPEADGQLQDREATSLRDLLWTLR